MEYGPFINSHFTRRNLRPDVVHVKTLCGANMVTSPADIPGNETLARLGYKRFTVQGSLIRVTQNRRECGGTCEPSSESLRRSLCYPKLLDLSS